MGLAVYFPSDIRQKIVAGLVLAIEVGPHSTEYANGLVSFAKYEATAYGLLWQGVVKDQYGEIVEVGIVDDVRALLGQSLAWLLDATMVGESKNKYNNNRKAIR